MIENIDLFLTAIKNTKHKPPFDLIAWTILPDHFHFLVDPAQNNPSKLIQRIKMSFGVLYRVKQGQRAGRIWQNRFWDHLIKNQEDFNHHIDYIHFNPVKHGYVDKPADWKYSSFHGYFKQGVYQPDWGVNDVVEINGEYGE